MTFSQMTYIFFTTKVIFRAIVLLSLQGWGETYDSLSKFDL